MANSIVVLSVNQQVAPTPSTLQQTGAFISQGGTTLAPGVRELLTSANDLSAIIALPLALSSLVWSGGVVTATTTAPHGFSNGAVFNMTIAGATPTGYNGTFLATITGASTFTYPLVSSPGFETAPGTYLPASATELNAMNTTFWGQGNSVSVYVLELGAGSPASGVTALNTYIQNNPGQVYSWLVPRAWSSESTYLTFLAQFGSTTAKTYFFTTMTTGNYTSFTAQMKDVIGLVEAPGITPSAEFSLAAAFWITLSYLPSTVNKIPPLAFTFVFGVTPYPTAGNGALLAALKTAGVNYIGTGAEGGISDTILLWGTTMDVRPFNYWFSVDWVQINGQQAVANAVINGSNNRINPLYFNQDGINRSQKVLAATMNSGVTSGWWSAPSSRPVSTARRSSRRSTTAPSTTSATSTPFPSSRTCKRARATTRSADISVCL